MQIKIREIIYIMMMITGIIGIKKVVQVLLLVI